MRSNPRPGNVLRLRPARRRSPLACAASSSFSSDRDSGDCGGCEAAVIAAAAGVAVVVDVDDIVVVDVIDVAADGGACRLGGGRGIAAGGAANVMPPEELMEPLSLSLLSSSSYVLSHRLRLLPSSVLTGLSEVEAELTHAAAAPAASALAPGPGLGGAAADGGRGSRGHGQLGLAIEAITTRSRMQLFSGSC